MNAATSAATEAHMKAMHGFRTTMKARPGEGDERVALLLTAATGSGPATDESCVLNLVGRSASEAAKAIVAKLAPLVTEQSDYQEEVPVGGKFNVGAMR